MTAKTDEKKMDLQQRLESLAPLIQAIKKTGSTEEKLDLLNSLPEVTKFIDGSRNLRLFLAGIAFDCDLAIKSVIAVGQGPVVFNQVDVIDNPFENLREIIKTLLAVEQFYDSMGGIIGYYYTALELISKQQKAEEEVTFHIPIGMDLNSPQQPVRHAVREGIDHLPQVGEIYPIGGAGDRLNLRDPITDEPLPAAFLPFGGKTLLESLMQDLQAKEYLYWKLHHQQLTIPVALMTSKEKNNTDHILNICNLHNWFGRGKETFKLFEQPLVPVIVETGDFSLQAPLQLKLKPGGHGVLWKLALDSGVFEWFNSHKCKKVLLRQINNPVAATDNGILALTGLGCSQHKIFGIASCPRIVNTAEGMIALAEKKDADGYSYALTNIEYTNFCAKGLEDISEKEGCQHSRFPANTNILFADLDAIKTALKISTVPGLVINLSHHVPFIDANGLTGTTPGGRLEAMMQNIAEQMVIHKPYKLSENELENLSCFVTYNQRRKTISVTKRQLVDGQSPLETPEACFYDILTNAYELFSEYCQFEMPLLPPFEKNIREVPSFIVRYLPAVGPLWTIIAQKIRRGKLELYSELQLEIAEVDIQDLILDGSLIIHANDALGKYDENDKIIYSDHNGKCELFNVTIKNDGIDRQSDNCYWRNEVKRKGLLEIVLEGNAEFFAENVTFSGTEKIVVPDGHRLEVRTVDGRRSQKLIPIKTATWHWEYTYDNSDNIVLHKNKHC